MIPDVLSRSEVRLLDNWPRKDGTKSVSRLARRIHDAVTTLLRSGLEPEEITIDIDRRAVIVRAQDQIHLRAL